MTVKTWKDLTLAELEQLFTNGLSDKIDEFYSEFWKAVSFELFFK